MRRDLFAAWATLVVAGCTLGAAGCDLAVHTFAGSHVALTMSGVAPTAMGHHLELWARDGASDIVRIMPPPLVTDGGTPPLEAYVLVPAVSFKDPCMIDAHGHLLWNTDADLTSGFAQPGNAGLVADGGEPLDQYEQALAVQQRIHQLTDAATSPMIALVSYDDLAATPPKLDTAVGDDAARNRLAACTTFWSSSPAAYSGNPFQLTNPTHGKFYGAADFTSTAPAQLAGGMGLVSGYALTSATEIWLTDTPATVAALNPNQLDCAAHAGTCRGLVFLDSTPEAGGNGVLKFLLSSPGGSASGTAAIEVNLSTNPVPL